MNFAKPKTVIRWELGATIKTKETPQKGCSLYIDYGHGIGYLDGSPAYNKYEIYKGKNFLLNPRAGEVINGYTVTPNRTDADFILEVAIEEDSRKKHVSNNVNIYGTIKHKNGLKLSFEHIDFFTYTDVIGVGNEIKKSNKSYRGTVYDTSFISRQELTIVVRDVNVQKTIINIKIE
jgi:hypothetical protein